VLVCRIEPGRRGMGRDHVHQEPGPVAGSRGGRRVSSTLNCPESSNTQRNYQDAFFASRGQIQSSVQSSLYSPSSIRCDTMSLLRTDVRVLHSYSPRMSPAEEEKSWPHVFQGVCPSGGDHCRCGSADFWKQPGFVGSTTSHGLRGWHCRYGQAIVDDIARMHRISQCAAELFHGAQRHSKLRVERFSSSRTSHGTGENRIPARTRHRDFADSRFCCSYSPGWQSLHL